jgi:hypothetical protein
LGPSESVAMANLDLIKDLELSRKLLAIQSCKNATSEVPPPLDDHNDVDSSVHAESDRNNDYDFLDVMVLRKGRKIKHRKKQQRKKLLLKLGIHLIKKGKLMFLTSPQIHFDDRSYLELSRAEKKF